MRKLIVVCLLLTGWTAFPQADQLAQNYYDRGEFEKAMVSYEDLLKTNPGNSNYFSRLVDCYQQLSQFDKAEKAINERFDKYKQNVMLVELGYNFQLQKNSEKAKKNYEEAIEKIKKNPNEAYGIGYTFERKSLFDYALTSYQTATAIDNKLNFNIQMALLYGQKGDLNQMIETYLNESYQNPQNLPTVQYNLTRFMNEDGDDNYIETLKKALLVRAQKTQDLFWNDFLSWLYIQQKEYGKAFIQQKAIYKRNPDSFSSIVELGQMAISDNDTDAAQEILSFVLENTNDLDLKIQAHSYLMEMKINKATEKDYPALTAELDLLIKEFGISPYSLPLLRLEANFAAFHLKDIEKAKSILKNAMEMPISRTEMAELKLELGDILLFEEKFNQALIYYSQVSEDLGGDVIGQEASLKTAKTSYYKGDFEWANHQLKVLKSASTQLIANDALDLYLLLSDNTVQDSTQTALKKFARADFFLYQNKKQEALTQFQQILKEHKGEEIEPVTLLRIGKTYEKMGDYPKALEYYNEIIAHHKDCIYMDEAQYFAADLYNFQLKDPEKAKPLYEAVIMNKEDSIYYVEARKKYRQLRGDTNL